MNPFQAERNRFKPPLPKNLKQIEALEIEPGEKVEEPFAIRSLFPKIANQPQVFFKHKAGKKGKALHVGVVLSGGQAAGGHNVIIGLFEALKQLNASSRLFGFLGGPSGLIENRSLELTQPFLEPFRNTGGFDMIGSGRTKIETPEQLKATLQTCQNHHLDGLVIIGGDDSNTNAAVLAEYFLNHECATTVIGVPKTIDGDLKNAFIETSFGFDTACKIYSEMIGNICRDALSAKKYTHFIKLMGRSASHIALECALQTHPNITLIGEEVATKKMTLKQITEAICSIVTKRVENGKNYGVILIPEGLIEFVPEIQSLIKQLNTLLAQGEDKPLEKLTKEGREAFGYLPEAIGRQLLLDRDPHGNVQVSHIATDQLLIHLVKESLKKTVKFSPVGHFFGYEGRCGYPSNFDATYCYALGFAAAALINAGLTGYMSAVQKLAEPIEEWVAAGIPLTMMMDMEERKGKKKPVIKKALVDLEGEPYKWFEAHREEWSLHDDYRFPGPIQFAGPSPICNETTYTLKLERHVKIQV